MEEKKSDILTRINRRDGMTVPDGFFESFAERMASELPSRPEAEMSPVASRHKTLWGGIRPYVYMAAMFAGIWCMLKMFTMMNPGDVDLSVDNNRILTEALSDENFVLDYIIDDINERELFDEMYDDSISVDDMQPIDSFPVYEPADNVSGNHFSPADV